MHRNGGGKHKQVKPILDVFFPLEFDDDSEGENETSLSRVDMLSFEQAREVCAAAVQGSGFLPQDTDDKTINFLRGRSMVDVLVGGEVVLARDIIRHGVAVSNAMLERNMRDISTSTTLEMQADLRDRGWTFSTDPKMGSIEERPAIDGNPSTYYTLLTHFCDIMSEYEAANNFHHKQSESYYKTLELVATSFTEDIVEVPIYKSAKFYQQLQSFFTDESVADPRQEETNNTQRSYCKGERFCVFQSSSAKFVSTFTT